MTVKNLLVELFVEELPPKSLKRLGKSFADSLMASLKEQGLARAESAASNYASPRRLAAHITNVAENSDPKESTIKLMPKRVGVSETGEMTDALNKRLAKEGYQRDDHSMQLIELDEKGIIYCALNKIEQPLHISVALQQALGIALIKLPITKVMSYQLANGWSTVNFVRPAHGLVALHGKEIIPVNALGLTAGRSTRGHRFESKVNPITLKDADSYALQLENEGSVIASFAARRTEITKLLAAAAAMEKLTPVTDDALLDEVTGLVERPNVLVGKFEAVFLEVPQECLILTMKANQKYFPLLDTNGKLTNKFLIVSNIRPKDPSLVIGGNERVVRPRLADAKFFFDQDRKKSLADRIPGLAKVVYHNKLGTQGERTQRVSAIASAIGRQLGGEELARKADQAALLSKADLLTDMVGEFPELQGIMGRYYAQHDGLSDEIAYAIEDHYKPRFAGDELPRNQVGLCVALADKLETLVGMFGIGQIPTGDKDPFALRRHALGVIRMLVEKELALDLDELLKNAFEDAQWGAAIKSVNDAGGASSTLYLDYEAAQPLAAFFYDRLSGLLREQGYSAQEVDAVLSLRPQRLSEVVLRLAAVRAFAALAEAAALAAANKRVGNILKKADGEVSNVVNATLLKEPAELALHKALGTVAPKANAAFERGDYTASLQVLAALREPVDTFFDNVMVNTEDTVLRDNRLALLAQLQQAMNRVADISKLAS